MKMWLEGSLVLALCALAVFGWTQQCLGPDPHEAETRIEAPKQPGDPYVVFVTVENRSGGSGSAYVNVRLIDDKSGETHRAARDVDLRGNETAVVPVEIEAPEAEYRAEVTVEYPRR